MKTKLIFLHLILVVILVSCTEKTTEKAEPLTNKIQYDVYVKSPNPDYDWWINNLPGPKRENLVNWIFDVAYSGEINAYDYFNQPMTVEDIKNIGRDTIYKTLMRAEPPFEKYDTMVVNQLEREDVTKVRFLEEWYLDEERNTFEKKVVAIAPVIEIFDQDGNFLANQPLFWLYMDEEYLKK